MIGVLGVIPARYGSTRLPGKPLVVLAGKPMIQWVVERAARARTLDRLVVATDDVRVARVVARFGGEAMLTPRGIRSGTDRAAVISRRIPARVVVNIQGDEPMLSPSVIDGCVRALQGDRRADIATPVRPALNGELGDPHAVKVAVDERGRALYFSRAPISGLVHIGVYAYRGAALRAFSRLGRTRAERGERLEQLRALGHGFRIRLVPTRHVAIGVDTPADAARVSRLLKTRWAARTPPLRDVEAGGEDAAPTRCGGGRPGSRPYAATGGR